LRKSIDGKPAIRQLCSLPSRSPATGCLAGGVTLAPDHSVRQSPERADATDRRTCPATWRAPHLLHSRRLSSQAVEDAEAEGGGAAAGGARPARRRRRSLAQTTAAAQPATAIMAAPPAARPTARIAQLGWAATGWSRAATSVPSAALVVALLLVQLLLLRLGRGIAAGRDMVGAVANQVYGLLRLCIHSCLLSEPGSWHTLACAAHNNAKQRCARRQPDHAPDLSSSVSSFRSSTNTLSPMLQPRLGPQRLPDRCDAIDQRVEPRNDVRMPCSMGANYVPYRASVSMKLAGVV
jgi:hypothetical protein